MGKKLKFSTTLGNVSIILGSLSIFLLMVGVILSLIDYFSKPKTYQEVNIFGLVVVLVGIGLIILVLMFIIKYASPFVGGIAMGLLGLVGIFEALDVYLEISYLKTQGFNPTGQILQILIVGLLWLSGGIFAILGSKVKLVFKVPIIIVLVLLALVEVNGLFQYRPKAVQEEHPSAQIISDFLTTLNWRDYGLTYSYLSDNMATKPAMKFSGNYNDLPINYRNAQ